MNKRLFFLALIIMLALGGNVYGEEKTKTGPRRYLGVGASIFDGGIAAMHIVGNYKYVSIFYKYGYNFFKAELDYGSGTKKKWYFPYYMNTGIIIYFKDNTSWKRYGISASYLYNKVFRHGAGLKFIGSARGDRFQMNMYAGLGYYFRAEYYSKQYFNANKAEVRCYEVLLGIGASYYIL